MVAFIVWHALRRLLVIWKVVLLRWDRPGGEGTWIGQTEAEPRGQCSEKEKEALLWGWGWNGSKPGLPCNAPEPGGGPAAAAAAAHLSRPVEISSAYSTLAWPTSASPDVTRFFWLHAGGQRGEQAMSGAGGGPATREQPGCWEGQGRGRGLVDPRP